MSWFGGIKNIHGKLLFIKQFTLEDLPANKSVHAILVEQAIRQRVNLMYADLSYMDLRNTKLRGGLFYGADFSHTDLRGADLLATDLRHANLTTAKTEV